MQTQTNSISSCVYQAANYISETISEGYSLAGRAVTQLNDAVEPYIHGMLRSETFYSLGGVVTCAATAAYLFSLAHPLTGALYGVTYYTLDKLVFEPLRQNVEEENQATSAAVTSGINFAVSAAIVKTVFGRALTYSAAAPLFVASFLGQALGERVIAPRMMDYFRSADF